MAPVTRRASTRAQQEPNVNMALVEQIKLKKSQLKPTKTRSKKWRKSRLPKVVLQDAEQRVLPPKPPVDDPLQQHIELVKAQALTLRKVDVRSENGVIIID